MPGEYLSCFDLNFLGLLSCCRTLLSLTMCEMQVFVFGSGVELAGLLAVGHDMNDDSLSSSVNMFRVDFYHIYT